MIDKEKLSKVRSKIANIYHRKNDSNFAQYNSKENNYKSISLRKVQMSEFGLTDKGSNEPYYPPKGRSRLRRHVRHDRNNKTTSINQLVRSKENIPVNVISSNAHSSVSIAKINWNTESRIKPTMRVNSRHSPNTEIRSKQSSPVVRTSSKKLDLAVNNPKQKRNRSLT